MNARSVLASLALATLTVSLTPLQTASAVTAVAAKSYGLQIQHAQRSMMKLEGNNRAVELDILLKNGGSHGLYDVQVFLIRPDTRMPVKEPARLRVLKAGESAALTFTFELPHSMNETQLRDVTFRIEAVDQATQQIVSFNQQSKEAR